MRDMDVRKTSQHLSSLRMCLRDIDDYGTSLVHELVCFQGNRMGPSQSKAAETLCSELEKEISRAVLRFHQDTGIGGMEDSPEL